MPELFNQLFRGVWSDAMKRALGVTKSPGGIERFGETLTPTLNLWERPEWAHLRQEVLCCIKLDIPAVVGEFGAVAVALPPNTQQILVIEAIRAGGTVGSHDIGQVARSVVTGTLAQNTFNMINRDQRFQPNPVTTTKGTSVETWFGSDPGNITGGVFERLATTAVGTFADSMTCPYVIKPGGAMVVQQLSANVNSIVMFRGYVRNALPGELVL